MRRDTPTGIQGRLREYGPHPVPARAASYGHLALFFKSEGGRSLGRDSGGAEITGNDMAAEMCRTLRPAHRLELFG